MRLAFILVRSEESGRSLRWRLDKLGYRPELRVLEEPPQDSVNTDECTSTRAVWVAQKLREIESWVEQCAAQAGGLDLLHSAIAVAELHDPKAEGWSFLKELLNTKITSTASLFLLAAQTFPEVHWIFWTYWAEPPSDHLGHPLWSKLIQVESLLELDVALEWNRADFIPLFDPLGFHTFIRKSLAEGQDIPAPYLPTRGRTALAIDEEPDYAYLNAYMPWRFGFRSWAVQSWRLAQLVLGPKSAEAPLDLVLEDLYLNFADRPGECRLSEPGPRSEALPGLEKATHRVLITVGPRRSGGRWRFAPHVLKPVSSVFDLWARLRRIAQLSKLARSGGFRWPPKDSQPTEAEPQGHSSPGPLFLGARCLISRARRLLGEADSVDEAIRAAALAVHAKELLGCRTPTTALEALALQHEAEVVAESLFLGVEHNIRQGPRFRDLEREVAAVSQWFKAGTRQRTGLNARLTIIERLAQRFQELHQIEEEMACLSEARKLRFEFWVREKWWRWPAWPFLRYLTITLHSLPLFLIIVAAWAVFFGLSYYVLGVVAKEPDPDFWDAMSSSWRAFFTGSPASQWVYLVEEKGTGGWESLWSAWLTFQGIISFTNLGLLLSHLYLIVSRR